MFNNIKVKVLIDSLPIYQQAGDYDKLLFIANILLAKDPNNAEYLLFKLKALEGLGKVTSDIKLLHHYIEVRSTDVTGYLLLYKAYMEQDQVAEAIFSLIYALSVDPDDKECVDLLANLLTSIDPNYKRVKINVLTTTRVGHLSAEIEPWARSRQFLADDECLHLFIGKGTEAANSYLFTLLKNYAFVIESPFWFGFYTTRATLLADEFIEEFPLDLNSGLRGVSAKAISDKGVPELLRIYRDFPAIVEIPADDLALGWSLLAQHNLFKEDKIVCLHLRDSDYLTRVSANIDWSYHDYRDADIATFKLTVESLIEQGYKVVRIGNGSDQALDLVSENYHDFCINHDEKHGDFFEVMLLSLCEFFIATTSGPLGIGAMFDTPTLCINSVPIEHPYSKHSRFIPKRLFKGDEEVNLMDVCAGISLSENNTKPIILTVTSKELTDNGYQYLANNEQDIYDAVTEFKAQLNNRKLTNEITPLQQQYVEQLPDNFRHKKCASIICHSFLAQYPEIFIVKKTTSDVASKNEFQAIT